MGYVGVGLMPGAAAMLAEAYAAAAPPPTKPIRLQPTEIAVVDPRQAIGLQASIVKSAPPPAAATPQLATSGISSTTTMLVGAALLAGIFLMRK
jgi:hypothetical protein